jgi:galacturan 1,4-alpha-galacturonidase
MSHSLFEFCVMLYSIIERFLRWTFLCSLLVVAHAGHMEHRGSECILTPGGAGVDDSPAILAAFRQCGHNGHIVFQNTTYHIERVMNTTGLVNCVVDIKGTLLVGDLIPWF